MNIARGSMKARIARLRITIPQWERACALTLNVKVWGEFLSIFAVIAAGGFWTVTDTIPIALISLLLALIVFNGILLVIASGCSCVIEDQKGELEELNTAFGLTTHNIYRTEEPCQ